MALGANFAPAPLLQRKRQMSKNTVKDEIRVAVQSGGSTLTKSAREAALNAFHEVMKNDLNIQIKSFKTIKTAQIQAYVNHLKEQNLSIRSIQNNLAHIRSALKAAGRADFAEREQNSNAALGASGASRDGTHKALTTERFSQAHAQMTESNRGAAAALQLQKELGLRAREAVQCVKSLKSWEKALEAGKPVNVLHGTKGGRPRVTMPTDQKTALEAVKTALAVVKEQGGALVRSESLQGAMRAYGRECERVGLTGESASHAVRCMYAQERFKQHLEALGDRKEALAATSMDLGHGDGRGTYVAQVYLKG